MPAIVEAWRAGLLSRSNLARNIGAGIVVGVVALPLAMAFAIASGASPEQGLYTALVAGLVVTLMGGTRVQIAGPTGAFTVLLFGVTAKYGLAGLQVVTLLAGIMLLLLGLSKLGGMVRYIPESVILGFTAGIAVVIWVGQWPNFFGLPAVGGESLLEKLPGLAAGFAHLSVPTTLLGLATLAVVMGWPKIPGAGKIPAPLVALVGATGYVAAFHPQGVATIGSAFGGVTAGLPHLTWPHLTVGGTLELLRPAVAVALLGAIESLLSATVADGMAGTKHDPDQELVGQGLANIAASLFGGFAATGAVARTATSVRHGGNSPIAGIVHAVTIALVLLVMAPLAASVPLTALAAILFVVAYNMSQVGRVVRLARRAPRSDVLVMLVTLVLAAFASITVAVEVGVILAMLNFFRRMTDTVDVHALSADQLASEPAAVVPDGVVVFTIDGPFFFGAVDEFESALAHTDTDPAGVVIDLRNVPFVDLTGLVVLKDALESLSRRGVHVAMAGANADVAVRLERAEVRATVDVRADAPLAQVLEALRHALSVA